MFIASVAIAVAVPLLAMGLGMRLGATRPGQGAPPVEVADGGGAE